MHHIASDSKMSSCSRLFDLEVIQGVSSNVSYLSPIMRILVLLLNITLHGPCNEIELLRERIKTLQEMIRTMLRGNGHPT